MLCLNSCDYICLKRQKTLGDVLKFSILNFLFCTHRLQPLSSGTHTMCVNAVFVVPTVTEHCVWNSVSALPVFGAGMWGGSGTWPCERGSRYLGGCGPGSGSGVCCCEIPNASVGAGSAKQPPGPCILSVRPKG